MFCFLMTSSAGKIGAKTFSTVSVVVIFGLPYDNNQESCLLI